MNLNEVTIAIPLHNGSEFSEIVFANIQRLSQHCQIIVSDCTENDDLLEKVLMKFGNYANLSIIRKRNLETGWVPHWNDLMERAQTKYFMWLSQDDEVELEWVTENFRNLEDHPDLAGSFGLLYRVLEDSSAVEYDERFPVSHRRSFKFLANELINSWNLGIATRAIWNKSKVLPILDTQDPNSEWADIVWIYGTLLEHKIGQINNVSYRKRWYKGSAHSNWRPFDILLARNLLLREINRRNLSLEPGVELLEICLANQIKQINDLSINWNNLMHEKDQHLNELNREKNQHLNELNKVLTSKSWRLTQPIRAAMKSLRNF